MTEIAKPRSLPPLRQGDNLSPEEFLRRSRAMPEGTKAELLDGVVFMGPPVSYDHGNPHLLVSGWVTHYMWKTPRTDGCSDSTVRLGKNLPQPDVLLLLVPPEGIEARLDETRYVRGAPELVIEIAHSTEAYDLHQKKRVYRDHGCREYLALLVEAKDALWFSLRDGEYAPLAPEGGVLRSNIFPGLWLDARALFARDVPRLLSVLEQGLASKEHADFVLRVAQP